MGCTKVIFFGKAKTQPYLTSVRDKRFLGDFWVATPPKITSFRANPNWGVFTLSAGQETG